MTITQYKNKLETLNKRISKVENELDKLLKLSNNLQTNFQQECKHRDIHLAWRSRGTKDDYGCWNGEDRWLVCSRCGAVSKRFWFVSEHSNIPDLSDETYKTFTGREYKGNIR